MASLQRGTTVEREIYEPYRPPLIEQTPPANGNATFFHFLEALALTKTLKKKNKDGESQDSGEKQLSHLDINTDHDEDLSDEEEPDLSTAQPMHTESVLDKMQHSQEVKDEMAKDDEKNIASRDIDSPPMSPAGSLDTPGSSKDGFEGVPGHQLEARLAELTQLAVIGDDEAQGVFNQGAEQSAPVTSPISDAAASQPGHYLPTGDTVDKRMDPARLKLLTSVLGESSYLPGEPEHFIAESQGLLVASVLLKGRLFLTNHRLIFYALLPSLEADRNKNHIVKAGPVIGQIYGKRKQRYHAVLTRDTISLNKTTKDLYTPSGMLSLNDIVKVVEPDDVFDHHLQFVFIKRFPNGQRSLVTSKCECDTPEEAISWRREIASAVFNFQNKRQRYRAVLPLDRITSAERYNYFSFSTVADLVVTKEMGESRSIRLGIPLNEAGFFDKFDAALQHVRTAIPENRRPLSDCPQVDLFEPMGANPNEEPLTPQRNASVETTRTMSFDDATPPDLSSMGNKGLDDVPADKIERRKFRLAAAHQVQPEDIDVVYHAELPRLLSPISGVLGVSKKLGLLFFARRTLGNFHLRIPLQDVQGAHKTSSLRFSIYSLRVLVRGHEDVELELHSREKRDAALHDILALVQEKVGPQTGPQTPPLAAAETQSLSATVTPVDNSLPLMPSGTSMESISSQASASPTSTPTTRPREGTMSLLKRRELPFGSFIEGGRKIEPSNDVHEAALDELVQKAPTTPMTVPLHNASLIPKAINFELGDIRVPQQKICCMTIGSRGDVQPYIALCKRFILGGQKVCIATHPEYKEWVESYGIEHRPVGGDPTLLMQVSVEHKIFSLETLKKFRKWMDDLLDECYAAAEGMDLVIESPSTMAGIHVCESRKIGYVRAFTMPWTRTRAFPHAFMSGSADTNGSFNYSTYILFENIMWKASSGQINRFRKKIGLEPTDLDHMRQRDVPFIYNFSTAVVPRPLDWPEHVQISGYWFLQTDMSKWTPPEKLSTFLEEAKQAGKPIVYIGFGSITVPDPAAVTKAVIEAVETTGVACILCKGWSSRLSKATDDVPMPKWILQLTSVPHDWLFDHIDAAMHHGGAGTTAASLRAGIPTLIKPFFGDQYFWARTVTNNGSGLRVHSLSAKDMGDAIAHAVSDRIMREKAEQIGEKLRAEDGLGRAVKFVSQFMLRAQKKSGGDVTEEFQHMHSASHSMVKGDSDFFPATATANGAASPARHAKSPSSPPPTGGTDELRSPGHRRASFLPTMPKLPSIHMGS